MAKKPFTHRGLSLHFNSSTPCHVTYLREQSELSNDSKPPAVAATHTTTQVTSKPTHTHTPQVETVTQRETEEDDHLGGIFDHSSLLPPPPVVPPQPQIQEAFPMDDDDDTDLSNSDSESSSDDNRLFSETEQPYRDLHFPNKDTYHSKHIQDLFEADQFRFHARPSYDKPNCKLHPNQIEQLYDLRRDRLMTYDICQKHTARTVDNITEHMIKTYHIDRTHLRPEHKKKTPVMSRKKTLKELASMYGMAGAKPIKRVVKLPHTGATTTIISYPFAYSMLSLLTDACLMQSDNLLLPPETPYGKPPGCRSSFCDDIDTGSVFKKAHTALCKDKNKDVLCGLILGSDGTTIDALQKHSMEPLIFTLAFFKRRIRQMPQAWRILGYLPSMESISPQSTPDDKLKDYHFVIRTLLWDLTSYQRVKGGLDWQMKYRETNYEVKLHIPVFFIIGDNQGHDKWVGLKMGNQQGALCRYCHCPYERTDDPFYDVHADKNLRKASEMERLLVAEDFEALQAMNFKPIRLGTCDLIFADPKRGIYGATLAEVLHSNQKGLCEYAIKVFWNIRKITKKRRKKVPAKASAQPSLVSNIPEAEPPPEEEEEEEEDAEGEEEERSEVDTDAGEDDGPDAEEADEAADSDGSVMAGEDDAEADAEAALAEAAELAAEVTDTDTVANDTEIADQEDLEEEDGLFGNKTLTYSRVSAFKNKETRKRIDVVTKQISHHMKWRSDRHQVPRTNFPDGMTSLAKVNAHEIPGMLLVLLFVLVMDYQHSGFPEHFGRGRNKRERPKPQELGGIFHSLGPTYAICFARMAEIVKGLSLLLEFEAFNRWSSIPRKDLETVSEFLPFFLEQYAKSFNRQVGKKFKILKYHVALHLAQDMLRFGSAANFNGSIIEYTHTVFAKQSSKRTQKQKKKLDEQCMNRVLENQLIEKAYLDLPPSQLVDKARKAYSPPSAEDGAPTYSKTSFASLEINDTRDTVQLVWWKGCKGRSFAGALAEEDLIAAFRDTVFPNINEKRVDLFTCVTQEGEKYDANPCYGAAGAARQNWAVIGYDKETGDVPAHLLVFFTLTEKPIRPISLNGSYITQKGHYVCCHVLPCMLNLEAVRKTAEDNSYTELAHPDQRLIFRCQKWDKLMHEPKGKRCKYNKILPTRVTPSLRFEKCESIVSPCIAIPDFYGRDDPNHTYYVLRPHRDWAPDFATYARGFLDGSFDKEPAAEEDSPDEEAEDTTEKHRAAKSSRGKKKRGQRKALAKNNGASAKRSRSNK